MTQPNVILQQCSGGHPTKLPVSKSAVFEDGPRVCDYGDENQRPESVTGRGYMAETYHDLNSTESKPLLGATE